MIAIIIFGSTGLTHEVSQGVFWCPACQRDVHYGAMRVSRYFTLYFIPLFPIGTVGEYVECRGCGGQYNLAVLDYRPSAAEHLPPVIGTPAVASPAWSCQFCQNHNPGEYSQCARCQSWKCLNCGHGNQAASQECLRCRVRR